MNEKLNEFNNKLRMKRVAIIGAGVSNVPLFEYLYNLDSKIYYTNEKEYVLGLALRDKLNKLYNKGYRVKKLEKSAKRLVKRELIKSGINEFKNRVTRNMP